MATIPRILYMLWLQGERPGIVRMNFERWARLNPNYRLEILDQSAALAVLAGLPLKLDQLTPQALSDVLRLRLLHKTGGIWADATVFPAKPLDDWLPQLITPSGFFAFERPKPDRPISSWFLAATPDNAMIRAWWQKVLDYWSVPRTLRKGIPDDPVAADATWPDLYPYFWLHYIFQMLVDRDADFAQDWAACAKLSADAPLTMQRLMSENSRSTSLEEIIRLVDQAPVHKLNWRASYPMELLVQLSKR